MTWQLKSLEIPTVCCRLRSILHVNVSGTPFPSRTGPQVELVERAIAGWDPQGGAYRAKRSSKEEEGAAIAFPNQEVAI